MRATRRPSHDRAHGVFRTLARLAAASAILAGSVAAHASDETRAPSATPALAALFPLPPPVLVGVHGGGGDRLAHAPTGPLIGIDAGWATMLGSGSDAAHGAWAFGARAGYQFSSGLSLQARFDDLGVHAPDGSGPLLFATGGVRYVLPFIVMPFAEALVGTALYGPHASPGAGLGLGVALPVGRHLSFDFAARDWIADVDGTVRHIPAFEIGLTVGFGGRGR